ncbi:hypothetical protein SLEP1_g48393 [Rubroshorea leprosula]|nr:hypothetical protein SLEP1_g48393 [Rubroshorea leprosula]
MSETNDRGVENNLYPFVHLNVDGNLFIFANNRAILLDYMNNIVMKTYPVIPEAEAWNYPSSGLLVLLPLKNIKAGNAEAELLICGGGSKGSYTQSLKKKFLPALNTYGRMKITDSNPQWVVETMLQGRVMGDMMLLPDGNGFYDVEVTVPPSPVLAPSGFYVLYVVHQGVPSQAIWIQLQH